MQQYGFRASRNLAEVLDRNSCWDNLGIDRRDLSLLVGTSAAGVSAGDYQACIGLVSPLETQITSTAALSAPLLTSLQNRIRRTGDAGIGYLTGSTLNNDRAYTDTASNIYSASTKSYFSPIAAPDFTGGGQYKLGTIAFPAGLTVTGFNYQGSTKVWSDYFVRYPRYAQIVDSGNTLRYSPLYLAPPSAVTSNILWLDSEYSAITTSGSSISQWQDVLNRGSATQATSSSQPQRVAGAMNSRAGIRFDGVSHVMGLSFNTALLPDAATLIAVFSLSSPVNPGDSDYAILTSVDNSNSSWTGQWGLFTTDLVRNFPSSFPVNGTHVVSIRASNTYGIEYRLNGRQISFQAPGSFTFRGTGSYQLGGRRLFAGILYGVALYNSILDDKELKSQETYFRWRYGFDFPDPDSNAFSYTHLLHDEQLGFLQMEDGGLLVADGSSPDMSYIPTTQFLQDEGGIPFRLEDGSILENA